MTIYQERPARINQTSAAIRDTTCGLLVDCVTRASRSKHTPKENLFVLLLSSGSLRKGAFLIIISTFLLRLGPPVSVQFPMTPTYCIRVRHIVGSCRHGPQTSLKMDPGCGSGVRIRPAIIARNSNITSWIITCRYSHLLLVLRYPIIPVSRLDPFQVMQYLCSWCFANKKSSEGKVRVYEILYRVLRNTRTFIEKIGEEQSNIWISVQPHLLLKL